MSERRICKYCGMELSEDVPHGLRQCHLHAVTRITELEAKKDILEDQQREAKNHLIDKNLHIDSLYEEGYKLQQRIAELEAAQRWIPVSERLPQIGVRVLFYNNFIKNIHKGWYSGDEWVSEIGIFYNGDKLKRITHWMPLPKFPEVQE